MQRIIMTGCVLVLAACAVTRTFDFNSLDTVMMQADPRHSTLIPYDITGAEWVKNQPLMVNKEFNFGMAMSIEGAGVAMAVGVRKNKNKTLAAALNTMPALNLNQRFAALLQQSDAKFNKKTISVFGLLYGQPQAHLRTIVELYNEGGKVPQRYIDYSPWLPTEGEGSWTENNGERLWRYFDESLPRMVELMERPIAAEKLVEKQYTITGGQTLQRGRGKVLADDGKRVVILSTAMPNTVLSIPSKLVKISDVTPVQEVH